MPKINFKQPDEKPQLMGIELDYSRVNIGRAEQNDIVITNPSISAMHCHLKRVKGGFQLIDNNSTNGIRINDRQFDVIDIPADMQFYMGDVLVQFAYSDEEYETLDAEGEFEPGQKPKSEQKIEP